VSRDGGWTSFLVTPELGSDSGHVVLRGLVTME
jgi:hypothetical protein